MTPRAWIAHGSLTLAVAVVLAGAATHAQTADAVIPPGATALEGVPTVEIATTKDGATRRELDAGEAARNRLTVRIADGRFYWADRDGPPLTVRTTGEFTYLSSMEPGRYVRFRQINDRLAYVEHIDMAFGSVTYWGELRIVLGK